MKNLYFIAKNKVLLCTYKAIFYILTYPTHEWQNIIFKRLNEQRAIQQKRLNNDDHS